MSLVVFASGQGREDIKSDVAGFRKASNRCSKSTVWTVMVDKQKGDMRLDEIDPDAVRGTSLINGKSAREVIQQRGNASRG